MHFTKHGALQTRAIDSFQDYPGLTEQLLRIQGLDASEVATPPSIREALSSPAIFRAVSMIANIVGSLTLEAWRNGVRMDDASAPRLVKRPGVLGIPRDFFRDTAYSLATRGEYIWWVVDRDDEGLARALLLLPSGEVNVDWDENFPLIRTYTWRNKKLPTDDIEHGFFMREVNGLRGFGPLQLCGAAINVAVEADRWAARFFRKGGVPSMILSTPNNLNAGDAGRLVDQWLEREANEVRVAAGGLKAETNQVNPEQAQLLDSRKHSAADVATMFGLDADILNAAVSGSSLTYQNVGQRFDSMIRSTISPNYLEPIEHGISERLTRTTVARFDLTGLMRADVQTQANVYSTLTTAGLEASQAAAIAGLDSLVDTEPIPAPEAVRIAVPAA